MRILRLLTSMKMAIGLLILLSLVASLGTVIPQGMDPAFYIETYGQSQGQALLVLGLDHLYSVWWFLALGVFLVTIILLCSIQRWKIVRSSKGLGSMCIHLAFIVIVLGAGLNVFTGVEQQVKLSPGETVVFQESVLMDYRLELGDFKVDFYDNGTPSQYTSELALTDPDGITYHESIWVNAPYKRDRITIYQHSYGWEVKGIYEEKDREPLEFRLKDNAELPIEDSPFSLMTVFIPTYDAHSESFRSLSPEPRNPVLAVGLIEGENVSAMTLLRPGETRELGQGKVTFDSFAPYTGLLVKRDFGTPVVFAGFTLMILGFVLRYLPSFYHIRKEGSKS